jgi:hypothetical protein
MINLIDFAIFLIVGILFITLVKTIIQEITNK